MNPPFFNTVFLGNSVKSYILFAAILLLWLCFKKIFSRWISQFLLMLFGRFGKEVNAAVFVELLIKPIHFFISLDLIYLAINQLNYPLNEVIFERKTLVDKVQKITSITLIEVVDKLFVFLMLISVFWIILRIIDFVAHVFAYRASLTESKEDDQLVPFVKELVKITTITIAFFVILGYVFEINVLTLITGLGIGGIAIALAAKESLENLLGSFTIFVDKPFVVGDFVKINGIEGTVEKVGFRSTRIRTAEKSLVTMPNKKMIDTPLENMTVRNYRRIRFDVGLTYSTPVESIKVIAQQITDYINGHEKTNNDAIVTFEAFGASSLDLQVLYYIEMMDYNPYLKIKEEINFKIIDIVQQNHGDFAFPTQTVIHQYDEPTQVGGNPKT
ncbi:mechanosensitive ion channel protein MscS [Mucilaginibacter sp. PPCGB 2223]|uniref:mechanosensitive ion channel family protein n=1 Tax=Mucilaginibacter sp. PPCGB 2223 TaxID=1886027 RepID=UPI0008258DE8|nr:mechanosensitive ion channel family protein [Mucilaginibacter sp. PPCGB 2223]OCX50564.1 mechanosensitive ion channel protein MscS [Mucilaginibacter sp. PPCGB 2223]